jgi:hypothetical protein
LTGDTDYIDLASVDNQESGYLAVAAAQYFVWLLFPFGLPRWVRYSEAPIGGLRVPNGPQGIPVVSTLAPTGLFFNTAVPGIVAPLSTGLGPAVHREAVCVAAGVVDGTPVPGGIVTDGEWTYIEPNAAALTAVLPVAAAVGQDDYRLIAGTHFPPHARALRVRVNMDIAGSAEFRIEGDAQVHLNAFGNPVTFGIGVAGGNMPFEPVAGGGVRVIREFLVPRIPTGVGSAAAVDMFLRISWAMTGAAIGVKGNEFINVTGWKLTD